MGMPSFERNEGSNGTTRAGREHTRARDERDAGARGSRRRRTAALAAAGGLLAFAIAWFPAAGVSGLVTSTLSPTADAYVNASAPLTNFGTQPVLLAGASPTRRSYLKFSVPQLAASVSKATLRLYATESSATGFAVRSVGNNWSEGTIVSATAPNPSGTITASSGPVTAGTWVDLTVTSLVRSNATINFALTGSRRPRHSSWSR
jgi:hypothetical protein